MKRLVLALALTTMAMASGARADEPPEKVLEFVRGLRDKGYADLALQYLEALQKNPPAELKSILSMELAKTRIDMAKGKDPAQRLVLLKAAREEMAAFIKANPDRPETAKARLELARLASQQGKALLSKALRSDDEKTQIEEAHKAELQFIDAGKELDEAIKVLGALATKTKDSKLQQDQLEARFERALNWMELADSYIDTAREDVNRKKAEAVDAAKKIFEQVAGVDRENPTCALAAAWLIRCNQVGQDPTKAKQWYTAVLQLKDTSGADAAHRLAYYFHMRGILDDPTVKLKADKKFAEVMKEGELWMKRYKAYKNTYEGQGVQFELASAYYKQAAGNKLQKSAAVAKLYEKAQKLLAALAESDSDFSQKANDLNLRISFTRMGTDTPIDKLKDFDECYLKGHYELALMKKVSAKLAGAAGPEVKKLQAEEKKHLKNVARAFGRALVLADGKTSSHKIDEARFFLTTVYLLMGDPYRAAVSGEALAREEPPGKRSATAAGIALEAYANVLSRDGSDGNRHRLFDMAEFILKQRNRVWQGESVTPVAHYQLGMAFKRDDKFKEAIGEMEQIAPEFPGYIFAQCQLVFTAADAQKKAPTEAEKKFYQDRILTALKRIPQLPANPDPSTAMLFFFAQSKYAEWLYAEGIRDLNKNALTAALPKFTEMQKFVKQLQDQFAKVSGRISPTNAQKIGSSLHFFEEYAHLGMADAQYRAGNYDNVLGPEYTGKTVAEVKKLGAKPGPIALADYRVVGDLLGLALRANVQKGKMAEAQEILKLVERLRGNDGGFSDPTVVLRTLIQELETQVKVLRKAGDSEKLKTTIKNFSAFVDELAKNPGKKKMEPADYFFLGHCYAGLEQYQKAAEMYKMIGEPACLNKAKLDESDERQLQTYWYSQIEYARMLRQSAGENKKANLGAAYKILTRLKNHPNARGVPDAEMEILYVLEEDGNYARAASDWNKLLGKIQRSPKKDDPKMKEMYFDGYYHMALSLYRYSQTDKIKGQSKGKSYLRRAADYIFRLEKLGGEGWDIAGPRFRELMEREAPLREVYDEMKKTAP